MTYNRFKKQDYMLMAESKGFEHLGIVPSNVKEQTLWRCTRCGKEVEQAYRSVKMGSGCSCKRSVTMQEKDYHRLARRLGIEWVYNPRNKYSFPTNSKELTVWRNPDTGVIVEASWHMLTHYLRTDLAEALGIEPRAYRNLEESGQFTKTDQLKAYREGSYNKNHAY